MKSTSRSSSVLWRLVVLGLALGLSAMASAATKMPEVSPEGLKLVKHTKLGAVYMKDGASFSGYDKVAILDCYVAFEKDWQRQQNEEMPLSVSANDVLRIKQHVADEFKKVFTRELEAKGETVVTSAAADVLVLRPAIVNLDITSPDTMDGAESNAVSISASAGQMTLYLELYDAVSNELLARVMDPEALDGSGMLMVRDSVTNQADADMLMKKWADTLGNYLQHARESSPAK